MSKLLPGLRAAHFSKRKVERYVNGNIAERQIKEVYSAGAKKEKPDHIVRI